MSPLVAEFVGAVVRFLLTAAGAALVSEIGWMVETDLRTMAAQQVNLKRGFL